MKKSAVAALSLAIALLASEPSRAFPVATVSETEISATTHAITVRRHYHLREETHQFHGLDDYYDNNSQLGILFYWLMTGRGYGRSNGSSDADANWCAERYRSYRPSDNTFQPIRGPRRQCVSPYD